MIWLHDPPARGSWNMAIDEALLHRAAEGAPPVLRFYEWEVPTLSLGYFQRYADRTQHPASADCAAVRRATGGGAILHDRELTYSCILPPKHPLGRRAAELYNAIHTSIVAVLAEYGLNANLLACGDQSPHATGCGAPDHGAEPFLCFERRTPGDVLLYGWKIAGSAQRRQRGAVLQHGSILFERSPCAPELPGIHDLTSIRLDRSDFARRLKNALSVHLGDNFAFEPPQSDLTDESVAIEASKFAADHWLRLR
ncbi:MAG: lipoate--protein ligase family protein [Pirellulales bacterium]